MIPLQPHPPSVARAARAYAPSLGSQAEVEEWLRKGEQRQACFDKDVERLPRLAGSRLELDLGKGASEPTPAAAQTE